MHHLKHCNRHTAAQRVHVVSTYSSAAITQKHTAGERGMHHLKHCNRHTAAQRVHVVSTYSSAATTQKHTGRTWHVIFKASQQTYSSTEGACGRYHLKQCTIHTAAHRAHVARNI